jgi:hypothetical protein
MGGGDQAGRGEGNKLSRPVRVERFDNKGKDNKRFYWTLEG